MNVVADWRTARQPLAATVIFAVAVLNAPSLQAAPPFLAHLHDMMSFWLCLLLQWQSSLVATYFHDLVHLLTGCPT